jgi:UDP-N-acetylmuramoyl-L-alanyl-D-glutamate--2,6-diaminopimelate ligase
LSGSTSHIRLSALLPGFELPADPVVAGISEDSRHIQPGWLFVAVPGTSLDGRDFIDDAVGRGACAVVTEGEPERAERRQTASGTLPVISVRSARAALADLAARFHGNPAADLRLVGFTGTFGKTSTSEVLRQLLEAAGRRAATLGSLGLRFHETTESGDGLTTPAPVQLHGMLRRVRDAGADTVIMEVTTHALRLKRVGGLKFREGLVAAIMPGEHTDFHRSYQDYVAAKRLFIEYLDPGALIAYDADNAAARALADDAAVRARAGMSVAVRPPSSPLDVWLRNVELDANGALFTLRGERMRSSLLGRPNVRNVGLALALALARDVDIRTARRVLMQLAPVPRRMERIFVGGRTVLDDVAAHPDSFAAVFDVAQLVPQERLLVVHGMRGNRGCDINRRNALALADLAALHGASRLIITAAHDQVEDKDRASSEEIDVARAGFRERAWPIAWHDTLAAAVGDAAALSAPGDLIVLVGAQAMTAAARLLAERLAG